MTDWLMVIITAIYVIATIVICVFNGKAARAAKEQIETAKKQIDEMIRQYDESNRPYVVIRFDMIRSGLICFVLENIGKQAAIDVRVSINEDFIKGIELDKQIGLREATQSALFLATQQRVYILLGRQTQFNKIAENKAVIDISYNGTYFEHTEIDLWQYRFMLAYSSEMEDISSHLKSIASESKSYHKKLLKEISNNDPVSVLVHSSDDSKKFEVFKTVCMNPGSSTEQIAKTVDISMESALAILVELDRVDRFIYSLPVGNDDMKAEWYRR